MYRGKFGSQQPKLVEKGLLGAFVGHGKAAQEDIALNTKVLLGCTAPQTPSCKLQACSRPTETHWSLFSDCSSPCKSHNPAEFVSLLNLESRGCRLEPVSHLTNSFQRSCPCSNNHAHLHASSARQGYLSIYEATINGSDVPFPISLVLSSLTMPKQTYLGG